MTIKRLNYFHYQFLQEGEFQDEQSYHRDMRLSHNRSLHAWGIVEGLLVTGSSQTVTLGKGLAIDKDGREIVIETDTDISIPNRPSANFYMVAEYKDDDHNEAYRSTQPGLTDRFTRIMETYEVSWPSTAPGGPENKLILARIQTDASGNIVGTPDLTERTEGGAKLGEQAEIGELKFRLKNHAPAEWPGIKAAERTPAASGVQNLNVTAFQTNFSGDVEITGTLHVSTIVKQTELRIDHNIITVNTYPAQPTPKLVNGGLEVFRGGTAPSAQLIWDESADRWKLGVAGSLFDVLYGPGLSFNETTGAVGIGTASPLRRLHLHDPSANSTLRLSIGSGTSSNIIEFCEGGTLQASLMARGSGIAGGPPNALNINAAISGAPITLVTASGEKIRIADNGNVGIGTTDPQAMLHVAQCVAIGPLAVPAAQGRLYVAGPTAEIGLVRRTLGSWPGTPAAGDRFLWYNPNGTARLWTDQKGDLLTVTSSGHVLIGTPPPTDNYILEVAGRMKVRSGGGTETAGIWFSQTYGFAERAFVGMADNLNVGFWGNTGAGWGLVMNTTNGNVGIGTPSPQRKLHVVGDALISGNVTIQGTLWAAHYDNLPLFPSDLRLKKSIQPMESALSNLAKLRGIRFEWKEPEKFGHQMGEQFGLIAQEVEPVFPQLVSTRDEQKVLNYYGLIPVVIEAIKEQQVIISKLQEETAALKSGADPGSCRTNADGAAAGGR